MKNSYFDAEEEQEQTERAADPHNLARAAAHANAVYKTDFAEWFLRILALRYTRKKRAQWEPDTLEERQQWRLKFYLGYLKYQRKLRRKTSDNPDFKTDTRKRADRKRISIYKFCQKHGAPAEDWNEATVRRLKLEASNKKIARWIAKRQRTGEN